MASPRVSISRRLPEAGLAPLFDAGLTVDMRQADDPCPREELLARVLGATAAITLLTDRVDDAFLDAAGDSLRIVANYAVGYDNVDVAACSRRGVAVANTPDVLTEATADHAFALLLAVARRLREGHALAASGRWSGWQPMQLLGRDVGGATLGIVGMGRIGGAVARRGLGFGMRVLYHNRHRDEAAEAELGVRHADLDTLLGESDVVSLHAPLTPETRHLIDADALGRMKPTAILVNTGRGPLVDEEALVDALASGRLWGAGLDVFEHEPSIHPGLRDLANVVLAPHTGSATDRARTGMARLCAEATVAVLAGRRASNLVNPDALPNAC
ncbi:MAG TPA: D-glycerate dehydrogenase [Trueperaceae bacterium]|nr:D-glycerate dehydrogenase [Trueperaceae bacterium]